MTLINVVIKLASSIEILHEFKLDGKMSDLFFGLYHAVLRLHLHSNPKNVKERWNGALPFK